VAPEGIILVKNPVEGTETEGPEVSASKKAKSRQRSIKRGLPAQPGLAIFAAQQLLPKLDAFSKEISGVRDGEDIEYLHRMRVASRRLRAAMPLFVTCFPPKKYEKWMHDIRQITRALGDARDTDVQIASLKKYRKKLSKLQAIQGTEKNQGDELRREAISYLLAKTRNNRTALQKDIVSALTGLENHRVVEGIQAAVKSFTIPAGKPGKKPSMAGISPVAASHITERLNDLLSHRPWVPYPDAVAEHHAMRIAAKKLRYTMELYSPVYQRGLRKYITRITKLQEILGFLHDCDVWIDRVTLILLKERTRPRVIRDSSRPGPELISGLRLFLKDREKERSAIYRRLSNYWNALERSDIWDEIRTSLVSERKKTNIPACGLRDEEVNRLVDTLASSYPEGVTHSKHVTVLALQLFDELRALHQLGERPRLLLGYAGLLHDIGLKYGQNGHSKASAEMILGDDSLPFDIKERGIIALTARSHRGSINFESLGIYSLFSPAEQLEVRMLASILRIANGLDTLHKGNIRALKCSISPEEIICDVTSPAVAAVEIGKATKKGDLFEMVFERPFIIR
jgi:CHAD domain-containing protein